MESCFGPLSSEPYHQEDIYMKSTRLKTFIITSLLAFSFLWGCSENKIPVVATPTPGVEETPAPQEEEVSVPQESTTSSAVIPAYEIPRVLDEKDYLRLIRIEPDVAEISVDVSKMAGYKEGALYQVTLQKADGTVAETDMQESKGKIRLSVTGYTWAEVSPVFRFAFGLSKTGFPDTDINVTSTELYSPVGNWYGFYGKVDNLLNGVKLGSTGNYFVVAVPDGYYNILFTKHSTERSLITVNGEAVGCNVGIYGAGGRSGIKPYTYYVEDVLAEGGILRIGMGEKDSSLTSVEIRHSSVLRPHKPHLYLAGDSTCSAYYPIETEKEPPRGRYQTGWGQLLHQFFDDNVAITNLGSGGTCARTWYDIAFGGVLQNAQAGDYFLIMHGINDQSYSNVDEMTQYLTDMIDKCREKGIIPILCTPIQSVKFWRDDKGKDLSEYEIPLGGGKAAYMNAIRKLADKKGIFLIDVANITGKQYGTLGRSYVAQNFHLFRSNLEEDTLHLSYAGAKNVASIIATELYRLQCEGSTDLTGAKVEGLGFNPMGTETLNYTDKDGNPAEMILERISAVYKTYGIR